MAWCLRIILVLFVLQSAASAGGDSPSQPKGDARAASVNYAKEVRPILSDNCFACHGPDDQKRKAGLRLDTKDGAFSKLKSGSVAIVPGKPDESELIDRIENDDPDLLMPPKKSGKQLTAAQIAMLRRWVEQGAPTKAHWAFEAPQKPSLAGCQKAKLAHHRDRPLHPGPTRSRGALSGPRGRKDDPDPARHARPDRSSADSRRGRRVPG